MVDEKIGNYEIGDILRGHNAEFKPLGVETKDYNFIVMNIMSQGVDYMESYSTIRLSRPDFTAISVKTKEADLDSNFKKIGHINLKEWNEPINSKKVGRSLYEIINACKEFIS